MSQKGRLARITKSAKLGQVDHIFENVNLA